jgi:cytochrome bd-type quinol oxidase subunit 2
VEIFADILKGIFRKGQERTPVQRAILGALVIFLGFLITFSPLLIAFLSTPPGGNMFSEGGGGGGSAIWLMIFTLPFGGLTALTGVVMHFGGVISALRAKTTDDQDESVRNKVVANKALALAVMGPVALVTTFLRLNLGGLFSPQDTEGLFGFLALFIVFQLLIGGRAIYLSMQTKDSKLTWIIASFVSLILFGYLYLASSYFPYLFFEIA